MYQSRRGRRPVVPPQSALASIILLLALASGGCSSANRAHQASWVAGPGAQQRASNEASHRTDLEDDGMEAQVPPPPSIRLAPDDPDEPYSPNYGRPAGSPAGAPASAPASPASQPQLPPSLRPTFRPKVASASDD